MVKDDIITLQSVAQENLALHAVSEEIRATTDSLLNQVDDLVRLNDALACLNNLAFQCLAPLAPLLRGLAAIPAIQGSIASLQRVVSVNTHQLQLNTAKIEEISSKVSGECPSRVRENSEKIAGNISATRPSGCEDLAWCCMALLISPSRRRGRRLVNTWHIRLIEFYQIYLIRCLILISMLPIHLVKRF